MLPKSMKSLFIDEFFEIDSGQWRFWRDEIFG